MCSGNNKSQHVWNVYCLAASVSRDKSGAHLRLLACGRQVHCVQRHHGSCRVRDILDPSVLEVRSLARYLECWFLAPSTVISRVCVPRAFE